MEEVTQCHLSQKCETTACRGGKVIRSVGEGFSHKDILELDLTNVKESSKMCNISVGSLGCTKVNLRHLVPLSRSLVAEVLLLNGLKK